MIAAHVSELVNWSSVGSYSVGMLLLLPLLLTANPISTHIKGFDKPRKEQRGTLGPSQLAEGKVTVHCVDVGGWWLSELNDPGHKGAVAVWMKKKTGDAIPCDGNDEGAVHLAGAEGFGHFAGTRGEFVFITSADAFGDRASLRVYSLRDGNQVYETEFSLDAPASLHGDGKSTTFKFHVAIAATCEPKGEDAASCWKQLRESAHVPESLDIKAPPCDAVFKGKGPMAGTTLISLPAEVELSASRTPLRFRAGAATCAESP